MRRGWCVGRADESGWEAKLALGKGRAEGL